MKPRSSTLASYLMGAAFLALSAGLTARADYQATVLSQGPVGYWRLQETTPVPPALPAANAGSLGAAQNGSYATFPLRGLPGALGPNGTAVGFDGLATWVQAPYAAAMNPTAFTIEAWLKPATATPNGNLTCVLSSMHTASPRAGWLIYQSGGGADTTFPGWQLRLFGQNALNTSLRLLLTNNVVAGTWYHIAFTFDGTTARSYLNGAYQGQATVDTYGLKPNGDLPFSIAARSDNGFPWAGTADEVAYYAAALGDAAIKAHYDAAIANPAGYPGAVLADAPIAYYRLDEPNAGPTENLGTLAGDATGTFVSPAVPGQPGATYPGFGPNNKAVGLDGTAAFVNIPALNLNTNRATFTAWVKPAGAQAANAAIVFSRAGTTVAGLKFDATDPNGLSYNWNNDGLASGWKSGLVAPADQWSFVGLIVEPTQAILCLYDGANWSTAIKYDMNHLAQPFAGATRIGSDNNAANSTYFNGLIDEVAIFNRTLGVGEVYSQVADAVGGMKPEIFAHPVSPTETMYAGDTIKLSVDAGGSAPLKYQWRKSNVPIGGATSSTYTKTDSVAGDSGNYDVVVSNGSGSVTSLAATVTINALDFPTLSSQPVGRTVYQGGTVKLEVQAAGGALAFVWDKDGAPVANETNATVLIASAQGTNSGVYKVTVSNRLGSVASDPATVNVIVPAAGSYEATVVADAPVAWWRLDEAVGATDMMDAMGRHDGTYQNEVTFEVAGAVRGGNKAISLAGNGQADVPYSPMLNTQDFTLECWAKTSVLGENLSPVSTSAGTKGCYFYTSSGDWRGGVGDSGAWWYVASETGAQTIQPDKWVHLVLTYGNGTSMRYYVNGQWDNQGYVDFERNTTGPLLIGARGTTPTVADMFFNGSVDEVAVYTKALTPAQILAHYNAGLFGNDTKPGFSIQPISGAVLAGGSYSFTVLAEGTPTVTYQWHKNGNPIEGATGATLTIANAQAADATTYKVVATNPAGSTESASATLAVLSDPAGCGLGGGDLVLHLGFEDNYQDSSGRNNSGTAMGTPAFVTGAIGTKALRYNTITNLESGAVTTANYVSLGKPTDLQFGTSQNFSVAYWIRMPAGSLPFDLPVFGNAKDAYTNPGYTFAPSFQLGGWSWSMGDSPGGSFVGIYGAEGSINNGEWHHLVHTFDRAGHGTTYLDGVRVDRRLTGTQNLDTGLDTCIGQDPTGLYAAQGEADVDDLAVWRRVLTPEEALCIYYVGKTYGRSFDTTPEVKVTVTVTTVGPSVQIAWPSGVLQHSDSLDGPWTPVPGANPPSHTTDPAAAKQKYYRVK